MKFALALILCAAGTCTAASFEVASVKPNTIGMPVNNRQAKENVTVEPGRLTMTNVTLLGCITAAYNVYEFQVDGPAWMKEVRFDIVAKAATPVAESELRLMLQTLLAERFHLTLHRVRKELPVYALLPGKRASKLRKSEEPGEKSMDIVNGAMEYRNYSMGELVAGISRPPFRLERPVIDKTGLSDKYNFSIRFAADNGSMKQAFEAMQHESGDAPSVAALIQDQLGLRLEAQKSSVEVLVIDSADKAPADN